MVVDCLEGHRLWASTYDSGMNPLLALEMRILAERLGALEGVRFLDAAAGTGRWMRYAAARGARVVGFDLCEEMVRVGAAGVVADVTRIPLRDDAVDLAVCSFALGYVPRLEPALAELGRVARRVVLSDLHPAAVSAGWKRGFRVNGTAYQIEHTMHTERDLVKAARAAGLALLWREGVSFGSRSEACSGGRARRRSLIGFG